jgi:hypothetical protein
MLILGASNWAATRDLSHHDIFLMLRAQSLLHFITVHHRIKLALGKPADARIHKPLSRGSSNELFAVFALIRRTTDRPNRFSGQEKHLHGMVRVLHR